MNLHVILHTARRRKNVAVHKFPLTRRRCFELRAQFIKFIQLRSIAILMGFRRRGTSNITSRQQWIWRIYNVLAPGKSSKSIEHHWMMWNLAYDGSASAPTLYRTFLLSSLMKRFDVHVAAVAIVALFSCDVPLSRILNVAHLSPHEVHEVNWTRVSFAREFFVLFSLFRRKIIIFLVR